MKNNNNYLDSKLRELIDFVPEAKPNWDAFYKARQHEIDVLSEGRRNTSSGKRFLSSSGFRFMVITLTVVVVFITGYYMTRDEQSGFDKSTTTPGNTVIKPDEMIIPSGPSVPDHNAVDPAKSLINPKPESSVNIMIDDKAPVDPQVSGTSGKADNYVSPGSETQGALPLLTDSMNEKPVVIKKTVIVQDTVRIKRTFQK